MLGDAMNAMNGEIGWVIFSPILLGIVLLAALWAASWRLEHHSAKPR